MDTDTGTYDSTSSSLSNSFVDEDSALHAVIRPLQISDAVRSNAVGSFSTNNNNLTESHDGNTYEHIINETYSALSHRSKSKKSKKDKKSKSNPASPRKDTSDRVVLNIGGQRFETYVSTLTKYPDSLLGTMFHERNAHLRKPDATGEYFFDRSPVAFESILNFYRSGKLRLVPGVSKGILEDEVEYWQIPHDALQDEEKLGNKCSYIALEVLRKKAEPLLSRIQKYILETIQQAAFEGVQSFSIEFKESQHNEFYGFLSNFSNRELLLHDLLQENFDVAFNDLTSGQGHSYILFITLWNRYTRQKYGESTATALTKILEELRQGVEIKTSKDAHVLTVKQIIY